MSNDKPNMDVLVVDIGGSSVKLWHTNHEEHLRFDSGKTLTPDQMVKQAKELAAGWNYECIALGIPTRVSSGKPVEDPHNLGPGWVGYNFASAFGVPVRVLNDAALQALGSYDGGRMVFIGLGTGVGSALVADHLLLSIDMGRLLLGDERACEVLSDQAYFEMGEKRWRKHVQKFIPMVRSALMADYVVLGGGNVKELEELPDATRRGHNRAVVEGGRRLWEELPDPADKENHCGWVIL